MMILLIEKIVMSDYFVVVVQALLNETGQIDLIGVWDTVVATIYITAVAFRHTRCIYSQNNSIGLG